MFGFVCACSECSSFDRLRMSELRRSAPATDTRMEMKKAGPRKGTRPDLTNLWSLN
jgi:hypothetical protein